MGCHPMPGCGGDARVTIPTIPGGRVESGSSDGEGQRACEHPFSMGAEHRWRMSVDHLVAIQSGFADKTLIT